MTGPAKSDQWIFVAAALCLIAGVYLTWWVETPAAEETPPIDISKLRGAPLLSAGRSTQTAAPKTPATLTIPDAGDGDYQPISFDVLGGYFFEAAPQDQIKKNQIPPAIRKLSGRKVAVQGFMVPTRLERGAVKVFMLVKDRSLCCFGRMPRMNEWVRVEMADGNSTQFVQDRVLTVFGTLEVGEQFDHGQLMNIYRVAAEAVSGGSDL